MESKLFKNYIFVEPATWAFKNFSPKELACPCCGEFLYVPGAIKKLQQLRDLKGRPLIINSAYRCAKHNKEVGGAPNSKHMKGIAFDIDLLDHDRLMLTMDAMSCGFKGIGQYNTFIHVDARAQYGRWDMRR